LVKCCTLISSSSPVAGGVTIRSQVSTLLANNKATRLQSFPTIVPQKFGLKKKTPYPIDRLFLTIVVGDDGFEPPTLCV
jgi:hypothetical protein